MNTANIRTAVSLLDLPLPADLKDAQSLAEAAEVLVAAVGAEQRPTLPANGKGLDKYIKAVTAYDRDHDAQLDRARTVLAEAQYATDTAWFNSASAFRDAIRAAYDETAVAVFALIDALGSNLTHGEAAIAGLNETYIEARDLAHRLAILGGAADDYRVNQLGRDDLGMSGGYARLSRWMWIPSVPALHRVQGLGSLQPFSIEWLAAVRALGCVVRWQDVDEQRANLESARRVGDPTRQGTSFASTGQR